MKQIIIALLWLAATAGNVLANTQPSAENVTVDTSTFTKNLNSTDTTVQKSLNTLDQTSGGGGSTNPGNPTTSFQYNNGGNFAGGNMYQLNNNIGIGSTNPSAQLDVNGGVRMQGFTLPIGSSLAGKILTSDANGNGTWQNNSAGGGGVNPGNAGDFSYYNSTGSIVSDQNTLILNNGNIGIGLNNPAYSLDINGGIRASFFVGQGIISNLNSSYIPLANTSSSLANSIIDQVNSNIGINSTSPGQLLDVQGTVRDLGETIGSLNGILMGTSGSVGIATSGVNYAPATSGTSILKGNNAGGFANAVAGTDYQGPLTFSTGLTNSAGTVVVNNSQNIVQLSNLTSNGLVTTTSGNGTLIITPLNGSIGAWTLSGNNIYPSGNYNVGIGSVNPGQILDVQGTIRSGAFQGDASGQMEISTNQGIGLDSSHGAYTTPVLLLTSAGNVGVNSATPGQQLDVIGTVRATNFTAGSGGITLGGVNNTSWPSSSQWITSGNNIYNGNVGNVGVGSVNPEYGFVAYGGAKFVNISPPSPDSNFASNVGIGTNAPGGTLDVEGTLEPIVFSALSGTTNVGIGTFMPNRKLTLAASSSGTTLTSASTSSIGIDNLNTTNNNFSDLAFDTTDSGGSLILGAKISGQFTSHTASAVSGDLVFLNKNTGTTQQNMVIKSGGNVGIGSPNPGQLLDVQGTVRAVGLTIPTNATTGYVLTALDSSGDATWSATGAGGSQWTTSGSNIYNSNAGNVGIGSTNPGQKLDVQGTVRAIGFVAGAAGITLGGVNNTSWPSSSSTNWLNNGSNVYISAGNVGIGSSNPGEQLDVNGTIRTTAFILKGNNATAGYVLTSLDSFGDSTWSSGGGAVSSVSSNGGNNDPLVSPTTGSVVVSASKGSNNSLFLNIMNNQGGQQ